MKPGSTRPVAGFTLIELTLSVSITSLAIIAAISMLVLSIRRASAISEVSAASNTQTVLEQMLRTDFENSGNQLAISRPFSGGQITPQFIGGPAYQITNDGSAISITKLSGGDWTQYPKMTDSISLGPASVMCRPPANSLIGFYSGSFGNNVYLAIGANSGETAPIQIYVKSVAQGASLPNHTNGDFYRLAAEDTLITQGGSTKRSTTFTFYRTHGGQETQIYSVSSGGPSYPLTVFAGIQDSALPGDQKPHRHKRSNIYYLRE